MPYGIIGILVTVVLVIILLSLLGVFYSVLQCR